MFRAGPALVLIALAADALAQAEAPRVQDPTRPYLPQPAAGGGSVAAEAADDGIVLTAILISRSRRLAVINGRVHREGERVNGDLITRIEQGAVRIARGGENVLVRLREERAADNDGDQGQ